ncbi:hypothetical protein ACJX0J_007362, partial [Zea mays]
RSEGSNSNQKQPSNGRATSAHRVSRPSKPASKPADRAPSGPSPLQHHAASRTHLNRSSASIDLTPTTKPSPGGAAGRRSFKAPPASRSSSTTD